MANLVVNNLYSFSLYPNSVLGVNFTDMKLVSIFDYNTALKFANVELTHRQIYPYLPNGTINDPASYIYYYFKHITPNSEIDYVIADVWLVPTSIIQLTSKTYTLTLNNISNQKLNIIIDQLKLLNINYTIS